MASESIVPLDIFKLRAFATATLSSCAVSMSFMGTIIFVPLYLQVALGVRATNSGLKLLPLMARLHRQSTQLDVMWRLFVIGLGLVPSQSLFNIIVQSAVPSRQIGVATSCVLFLSQITLPAFPFWGANDGAVAAIAFNCFGSGSYLRPR
jgi:hypothetical protein